MSLRHVYQLQALDAAVVNYLDGDAAVAAGGEGERDVAAEGFDQLFVNFGLEAAGKTRPAVLLAGHREEDLMRVEAAAVEVGVEHPDGDAVAAAGLDFALLDVVVVEALNFDLKLSLALVVLSRFAQLHVGLADEPEALVGGAALFEVVGEEVGVHLRLEELDALPVGLFDVVDGDGVELEGGEDDEL